MEEIWYLYRWKLETVIDITPNDRRLWQKERHTYKCGQKEQKKIQGSFENGLVLVWPDLNA